MPRQYDLLIGNDGSYFFPIVRQVEIIEAVKRLDWLYKTMKGIALRGSGGEDVIEMVGLIVGD